MSDKITDGQETFKKRIEAALEMANQGDLAPMKQFYDEYPALWRRIGDMSREVLRQIADWFGDEMIGEAVSRYVSKTRNVLGYETASQIERLLIDRVLACWLRVQQAEQIKTQKDRDGVTLRWATVWERRLAIAHRNFLLACKTLAQVRKLLKPRVTQVNIGGQQVNVANIEAGAAEERSPGPTPGALTD